MEKVYLLLRNNLQSGPFTIGELLQQQLKPTDMIWIEGRSTAWTYLSELELVPFAANVPPQPKTQEIKGRDEIERKAEELRQKVLNTAPRHFPAIQVERETYASPYKLPEEEIQFIDHRKERKTILGELAITCVVIGLFGIGIYKGREFLSETNTVQNSVATKLETNDQHAAQKNKQVVITASSTDSAQHDSLLTVVKAKPKTKGKSTPAIDSLHTSPAAALNDDKTEKPQENSEKTQPELNQPVIKMPEIVAEKKETSSNAIKDEKDNNVSAEKEDKKGFLKGLFKKKKKDGNE